MKVCHTSEIFTFQKTLILQLQVMLELSQFQELLSIYTDFLLLFAEYPSLFKFLKNEPNSLQGKNALFKNNFITQDPARDGNNWYCGQNPLTFTDPDGLYSRDDAVTYAHKWNQDRNSNYTMAKFPWSIKNPWDCADFASQVLNAGGIKMRDDWYNNPGDFNLSGRRTDKDYSSNWTTAKGLTNWLRSQDDIYNGESLIKSGDSFSEDLENAIASTKVGDVIGWSKDENGQDVHHVGIVTKIEDGKIYYDAHTKDRNEQKLDLNGDKSIVIIHIQDGAE